MTTLNCATGTLAPYAPTLERPWTRRRIAHMLRRMGFGGRPEQIETLYNGTQSPTEIVEAIIDNAIAKPLPPEPEWGNWGIADYPEENVQELAVQQTYEWISGWMDDMVDSNNFREKLELFWHNHFVTRLEDYGCPSYMYQYHTILKQHVLGDFKAFSKEIGKCGAMLVFLNGVQNTRFQPNENYARELFELFTLGQDNGYTQNDIVEAARALTGWNGVEQDNFCSPIEFVPFFHDDGEKTIFGQTGNWTFDDVHDLIFQERPMEVARYICTKLYSYFVNREVDIDIVNELSTIFIDSNFNLEPVYRQLFKSEHFFDDANMDVQVKSPIEMGVSFVREARLPYEQYFDPALNYNQYAIFLYFQGAQLGQQLMSPIDVSGWNGNRTWVNSSTLVERWQTLDAIIFNIYENVKFVLIDFASIMSDNSSDPEFITQVIVDHFIPVGLQTPADYQRATEVFKSDFVPSNYFEDGTWTLNYDEDVVGAQVALLLQHISRIPEFQLM